MAFFLLIVLSAAFVAGFILLLKWAITEDRKGSLREQFDAVIKGWGKEK